jgi:hypothetical protein
MRHDGMMAIIRIEPSATAAIIERTRLYLAALVLYPMILGLERIETTQLLRQNGVFQHLTGLPSYPDATTLRRFLVRVGPGALGKRAVKP